MPLFNKKIRILLMAVIGITVCLFSAYADKDPSPRYTKTYTSPDGHYTIKYPDDWIFDNSTKGAVTFSGKQNTLDYYSTINIQTLSTKQAGGAYTNVKDLMADIASQTMKVSPQTTFLDSGQFNLSAANGKKLTGEYMKYLYQYHSQFVEQWQIVLLKSDNNIFYIWAYSAPANQFEQNLAIAKAMLNTWAVH